MSSDMIAVSACLRRMAKDYLSQRHSVQLLLQLLRVGEVGADGVAEDLHPGWQVAKGGGRTEIPTHFWNAVVSDEEWGSDNWWYSNCFVGDYHDGNAPPKTKLTFAYRNVRCDWERVVKFLDGEEMRPAFFVDWNLPEPDHANDPTVPESRGKGRARAEDWNDWVAELAYRARAGEITPRTTVSKLLRSLRQQIVRSGRAAPRDGTVRAAATAVIARLSSDVQPPQPASGHPAGREPA